jgi:CRISPR-associated endonuclease/helicase Cas3
LPDEALIQRLVVAAEQGALVGVVCNLVTDAQQLYQRLVALCSQSNLDIPVDLFHARYCFAHRQHHEKQVLERYGKGELRARGRVLVATQVIEQSLDLDFDWLIGQICPVDLLFQRLGRLHRHERNNRPENFATVPRASVLVPVEDDDFGLHQLVYASGRFLWRTKKLLQKTPIIQFPAAYREWIEEVYDDEPWRDEPEAIQKSHEDYETKSQATYYCARQLANTEYSPTADTDENVACMTRDGDMNLSVLLLQESAKGLTTLMGKALNDLDEWDQQEAILLSTVGVPASWRKWLPETNESGVVEVAMKKNELGFEWSGGCRLIYRQETGLEKVEL